MKLPGTVLVPGMPVEAFIQTDNRSVMSYLARPLADQIARAFREASKPGRTSEQAVQNGFLYGESSA